ncbi:MAG: single-stranded DNA-binding protein [Candidatus Acetothermia bacterium]
MSASLNLVVLIGNLTADPELQYTQSGIARTNFSIAINRQYRDSNDELQEDTTFVPVVTWRDQAENCATYLSKGRSVAVVGRLRRRRWENDEGQARWFTEVVARNVQFLGGGGQSDFKKEGGSQDFGSQKESSTQQSGAADQGSEDDEEIPF